MTTIFTLMKRIFDKPMPRTLLTDKDERLQGFHGDSTKSQSSDLGGLFQTVLEGVILLAFLVMSAALGFLVAGFGLDPKADAVAFSVLLWAFAAAMALVLVLLVFNLFRRS